MPSGTDLLLQVPCLAGIDIAELERIPLRRAEFAAGEWVFTPHSPSPDLLFVAEGTVELLDASRADALRRVGRALPGDVFGEHRQSRRPPAWAARAATSAVLLRWPAAELTPFLSAHPEVRDGLQLLAASRRLASSMGFAWVGDDETVYGLARKHPALLARALLIPLVAVSAGLGILAAGGLNGSGLTAGLGAGLAAFGVAFGIWQALDWRNDYYIVTDRRVVWLEKVIGLYDNRQESPLRMILSVAINSGLLGRQLGYGDVEVRTYTGAITLRDTPHPEAFAATIEALGRRLHRSSLQADRQTIHEALEQRLVSGQPVVEPPSYRPAEREEPRAQAHPGLDRWSFEARFEEGGVITYRKHLAVLIGRLLLPTLLLLATFGLTAAAQTGARALAASGLFYLLVGVSTAAAVLWWLYEFADWANDLYQITPTHIVAVHKKPLGRESRKVAPLENILGTEVDRRGPIGMMLNFGDVVANVGASSFHFEGVLNPSAAQQDIVRAQEALVDRRMQSDRKRRQDEMVEWLAAYHQQTSKPEGPAAPDGETARRPPGTPHQPGP
jgi:CRP-like cAMP-binding protein